ncbi:MAG: hypothetical protein CUN57_01495, partial [Phototrophicales bacterium]
KPSGISHLLDYISLNPIKMWKSFDNPHPEINISLSGSGTNVGDVNGDGRTDIVFTGTVPDERTEDLGDVVGKTIVFWGGNESRFDYDQLVYADLIAIGDFNGDGFDDAVSRDFSEVYFGSANGYLQGVQSNIFSSSDPYPYTFRRGDLDGDGYGDVFAMGKSG